MALHAAVDIVHDAVLIGRIFSDFLDVVMTGVTDERCEILNELRIAASVRIMTTNAVVLGRFMNELVFFQLTFRYDVAGKTQLTVLLDQQVFVVGAVGLVTNRTFADGDRSMQKRKSFRRLVTGRTEIGDGFRRD